jgi:hypothetical protein
MQIEAAQLRSRNVSPELIERVQSMMREEFRARRPELIELYARIYTRYFSEAELREIIAFYRSATGRKVVALTPQMMKDIVPLATEWGKQISERVIERLRQTPPEGQEGKNSL